MEASMESNPMGTSLTEVAHSSCSSSLIADLSELQSDVHLSINSMLTTRRSSDLEIQCAIWDFETSLYQREAETATTNKKAKVACSRRDLRAKVKCAKAVMKAKYEYHMAVQEARAERCTELEESEATYSKALSKNMAAQSLQCATLHQEHTEHMWELEACALRAENKSCQDFLLAHQAILHQALQSLKEDLHSSYSLLLGPSSSSHWSITLTSAPQVEGQPLSTISLKPEPEWSPPPKRWHSSMDAQGYTSMDKDFPITLPEELLNSKKGKTANWSPPWSPAAQMLLVWIQIPWRRPEPITLQLTPGIGLIVTWKICPTYSRNSPKKLAYWVSLFSRYNSCGKDRSI